MPLIHGGPECCNRRHHPAPHRMTFDKGRFFLAFKTIELSLVLGYGRSHYTGNWTDVRNTTFGGAAGDRSLDLAHANPD